MLLCHPSATVPVSQRRHLCVARAARTLSGSVVDLVDWPSGTRPLKLTKTSLRSLGVSFTCRNTLPGAHLAGLSPRMDPLHEQKSLAVKLAASGNQKHDSLGEHRARLTAHGEASSLVSH